MAALHGEPPFVYSHVRKAVKTPIPTMTLWRLSEFAAQQKPCDSGRLKRLIVMKKMEEGVLLILGDGGMLRICLDGVCR